MTIRFDEPCPNKPFTLHPAKRGLSESPRPAGSPRRIQRKRTKGWRIPEGAVYVGRPTKWGNPFGVHPDDGGREAATQLYRRWLDGEFPNTEPDRLEWIREHVHELRGRDLACWCPVDDWCHADVLLRVANSVHDTTSKVVRNDAI